MRTRGIHLGCVWQVFGLLAVLVLSGPALALDYWNYGGNKSGGGTHNEFMSNWGGFNASAKCGTGIQQLAVSWVFGGEYFWSDRAQVRTVEVWFDINPGYAKWSSWSWAGQAALWGDFRGRVLEWNGSAWVTVRDSTTRFIEKAIYAPAWYQDLTGRHVTRRFNNVSFKANTWYAFDGYVELRTGTQGIALSELVISWGYLDAQSWIGGIPGGPEVPADASAAPPPPAPDPPLMPHENLFDGSPADSADPVEGLDGVIAPGGMANLPDEEALVEPPMD